jgi:hypothetical protein
MINYLAFKSWTVDDPTFGNVGIMHSQQQDLGRQALRDTRGDSFEWTKEARSMVHSVATHRVLRLSGKGETFKKRAQKAGFRVSAWGN